MQYEALCLIVKDTLGSSVLKTAKKEGMQGGTVFYGYGSSDHSLSKFFGVDQLRKECLFFVSDKETVSDTLRVLTDTFQLDKPNKGVAFTMPLNQLFGAGKIDYEKETQGKESMYMHQAIFVIVERGKSEEVLEAAAKVGSKGGTVIHARGSGAEETKRFFQMDIEPEKDIVLILAKESEAKHITDVISDTLHLDEPNSGILFQMGLNETRGLIK